MASMWPPKKNTAFTLSFTLYKNDGTVVVNPGTYTKKVSIDGAGVADIAAAVTEEDTTYGQLSLVLASGEMNGDWIWIYITDNTAGTVPFTCTLYTTANTQDEIGAVVANIHDTDLPAVKTDTAAILVDTGTTLDGRIPAALGADGFMKASIFGMMGTALTETAGQIAAAFKKLFDVATPLLVASDVMRGTDSAALASVCTETRLAELDAANLPTDIAARATPAQVNAEVLDVLNVDTFAEPGQEAPAATNTLSKKIGYLFKAWRNRTTQTASQYSLYGDDAVTVDQKATYGDDATTSDRGEIGSGL